MINKKEKYLRNYLNKDKFKENLSEQQNKVINEYILLLIIIKIIKIQKNLLI